MTVLSQLNFNPANTLSGTQGNGIPIRKRTEFLIFFPIITQTSTGIKSEVYTICTVVTCQTNPIADAELKYSQTSYK